MHDAPIRGLNPNLVYSLYFMFKLLPVVVSGISIYLGYMLFILGVTGKASLSIESNTVSGQLINAAPGLFFAIGGIVALIIIVWKGVKINFGSDILDEYGNRSIHQHRA